MTPSSSASGNDAGAPKGSKVVALVGLAMALAVAIRLRVLRLPFILDDFLQMAMHTGEGWVARAPWDRSRLVSGIPEENAALVDVGRLPWWTDLHMRISPFRPLSGLEGAVDYALHGANPTLAHAVSLAWLAVAVLAASILFRAVLPSRAALLSLFVYALSRAHGMIVAWIANRCALLSAVFAALALHGYVLFREGRGARFRWQALALLALALLSSEYALGAFGFLVAYEAFRTDEPLAKRAKALVPSFVLLVLYAVAFRALGYGAKATTLYADPLAMPGRFARIVIGNWPELVWLSFAPIPGPAPSRMITVFGALNALLVAALLFGKFAGEAAHRARFLFCGALLALVPVSVTWPQYRLLPVAELGIAASVGAIASDAVSDTRLGKRLAVSWLVLVHFVLAPVATVLDLRDLGLHDFFVQAALAAPLPPEPDVDAVVLESTQVFALHYPPLVRKFSGLSVPRTWRVLSCTAAPVEVHRTSDTELELRSLGQGLLDDPQAGVYRDPAVPLPSAMRLGHGELTVNVLETSSRGPTKIRFGFEKSLDDPTLVLLVTGPFGFRRVQLPLGTPPLVIPGG